jgi:hypothetical protein
MSSSITSAYIARHRATIHPLIAIAVPFLFIICMYSALRGILPEIDFPPPLFLPVLLLVGIEVTVMGNVFLNERARYVARMQEFAAVMALMWIVTAAVYSIRVRAFTPIHAAYIYPLALVFYQWSGTLVVHMHLREREHLLSALVGLDGDALLHTLRDSSLQAGVSLRSLRAVTIMVSAQQVITFAAFTACSATNAPVSAFGYVLCAVHAIFGITVIAIMRVYTQNQLLLGEGVVVPERMEGRRLIALSIIVAGAIPVAVLSARDSSLLPISFILGLLEKLSGLFSLPLNEDAARRIYEILRSRTGYGNLFQQYPSGMGITPGMILFGEALRRLFVTGIVAVAYFFLISPLLSEEFLDSLRRRRPIAFLRRRLRELIEFWKRTGRRFREWLRWRGSGRRISMNEAQGARLAGEGLSERDKLSLRKRIQAGRLVKAFLRLLRWAELHGVSYRDYETLLEFSTRLLPVVPESRPEVSLIVDVLEEALFSTHIVSAERVARYFSAIRGIRKKTA